MATAEHLCPFGLKALSLLRRRGYEVEDHRLRSRAETDELKQRLDVKKTPQIFVDGERIGGYDALRQFFGLAVPDPDKPRYTPVLAVFAIAAVAAVALQLQVASRVGGGTDINVFGTLLGDFLALSTLMLAMLKLRDVEAFTNRFLGYDLLARRMVRYAYVYPYAEAFVALAMLAGWRHPVPAAIAVLVGAIGAASVFKAVYIDKRELVCACVGADSKVPLGAVSLAENLAMVAMGVWMWPG